MSNPSKARPVLGGTDSAPDAYVRESKVIVDGEECLEVVRGMWSCGELQEITDTFPIGPSKHAIALREQRQRMLAIAANQEKK